MLRRRLSSAGERDGPESSVEVSSFFSASTDAEDVREVEVDGEAVEDLRALVFLVVDTVGSGALLLRSVGVIAVGVGNWLKSSRDAAAARQQAAHQRRHLDCCDP